jgi:hypothetical protein
VSDQLDTTSEDQVKSGTGRDSFQTITDSLERYEKNIYDLEKVQSVKQPDILKEKVSDIARRTSEDISIQMIELAKYALDMRRILNKEKAWRKWAFSKRDEMVAHELSNNEYNLGYSQQQLVATYSSKPLLALNKFIRELDMKIQRLDGTIDDVNRFADTINNLRFTKIQKEKARNATE